MFNERELFLVVSVTPTDMLVSLDTKMVKLNPEVTSLNHLFTGHSDCARSRGRDGGNLIFSLVVDPSCCHHVLP